MTVLSIDVWEILMEELQGSIVVLAPCEKVGFILWTARRLGSLAIFIQRVLGILGLEILSKKMKGCDR